MIIISDTTPITLGISKRAAKKRSILEKYFLERDAKRKKSSTAKSKLLMRWQSKMSFIPQLFSQPERIWNGLPPASETEIENLKNSVEIELPQEFLDLLRFSNGGEGDIALPSMIFIPDETKEISNLQKDEFYKNEFPNFFFFDGNGSLEMIGFDIRKKPYLIVMIDPIGGEESAIEIAPNITEFIKAIGLKYKDART